ncbi:helix-turn-helix domain-containing protein [Halorussus halophilus]|uniref:helix-turn-helix domain-containing protein n=1 Tax=Halorussus halophilus TaxID=2650975 RepID=UPI00130103B2|nr:helix-turn-helix domain-containing protein [Halorussus halophilus]
MQHLRLTFYADEVELHPVHTLFVEQPYVESARMVHWNDANETVTHSFEVVGDREQFESDLADTPEVLEYDLATIDDGRFYTYIRTETTAVQRALFDAYDRNSIVVTSDLDHTDDGGVSFGVAGRSEELQRAIDAAPEGIRVEVERVGGRGVKTMPEQGLSKRQREAVEVAVAVGYYDVPRTASHEAVAEELDCAPSTAAEHLRKAESKLLRALFA